MSAFGTKRTLPSDALTTSGMPVRCQFRVRGNHMRRRNFIAVVSGAVAWPLAARAQQATRIPRIGILSPSRSEDASPNRYQLWAEEQKRMPINFAKPPLNW
jgi:hypothetical protein